MLHEATYTMTNIGLLSSISIASNRTEVVGCLDETISCAKWNIIPTRGSNRYYIQNDHQRSLYAWCKTAKKGECVVGSSVNRTEWIIKETNKKNGNYIVSPSDDEDLFWGLEDDKSDTPVELKNGPTLRQNQWQFRHHSGPLIVENIIDDLQLTLDWIDATTQAAPFKAHISGNLKRSDLPTDATISFPKPVLLVWKKLIIGHARVKSAYGASQADKHAHNVLLTPTSDDNILAEFVRALLNEKSIPVELHVNEVTVHARRKDYLNMRTSFRKSITVEGLDFLKDMIVVEKIRVTGSDHNGNSLTARTDVTIRSPSNISLLVDELPIEVRYKGVKIAYLTVPGPFKLHHSSANTEFRALEIPVKFQPENSRDILCKEFITRYITTGDRIEITLSFERTMIRLASSTIFIPHFKLTYAIDGMDKLVVPHCTAYIAVFRALLLKKFDFTFDFDNPLDTPVTITFAKITATTKNIPLCGFQREMDMTVQPKATLTSEKFRKASIYLTLRKLVTFFGKREVKVEVHLQSGSVSIGQFHIQDLTINKLTDVNATIKWSL